MPTSRDIAEFLGSHVETDIEVSGASTLHDPQPNTLAFATQSSDENVERMAAAPSTIFLAPTETPHHLPNVVRVDNPRLAFARAGGHFLIAAPETGIASTAVIAPTARIGADVSIGHYAVIEDGATVGDGTTIGPHVVIHRNVTVGERCVIGSHCSIGNVGFGLERDADGVGHRLPHTGAVAIGDNVELGTHVSIARGTIDDTVIEDGAKIDNMVFIAHNAHIGRDVYLIAGALVCGSATIGSRSWVAPGAVIKNKVTLGADVTVGLGAVVIRDVDDATTVAGVPARPLG
jgi:UDP-3-O-[3-hydroxymyristoyl] glucosamine N-acyltransferase